MTERWNDIADSVRSRVRRLVLLRGLAWVCVVTVGLVWMAAVMDWAVHVDRLWERMCLIAGIVAASLTVLWRTLLSPLLVRLSDVDVARLIEQRLSQSDDRLSSAAQFRASQQDPQIGSPALQLSTIETADCDIRGVDVDSLFTSAPGRRAMAVATLVSLAALGTFIAAPAPAWTALARLAMPFADIPWPRTTRLRLLGDELRPLAEGPLRTTAGEPLTVYVENELGPLPDDLTLDLEFPDDIRQQQPLRTTLLRDSSGASHEVGVATLRTSRGRGRVRFRVWGGDDAGTAWHVLDVVAAATAEDVTITLTPPAYAARDAELIQGAGLIEGLVGSRVVIEGTATNLLSQASLHREHQDQQTMVLAGEGRRFRAEFVIEEPGRSWYWLELLDEHGLREPDPPRYELRGIADRPPAVYIDEPSTDLTVTPTAELPLRVMARDDIGLSDVRLRHTDAPESPAETAGSTEGEEAATRGSSSAQTIPLPISSAGSVEETVETTWKLGPLELAPGVRLTYWVEAVDACDRAVRPGEAAGQVGSSARRHLDVISETEKRRELAARQSGLLDALEALRDRQAQARDITSQLRIQAELAGQLRPADTDLLKRAEMEQRDIHQQLADESSGVSNEVETIQRELTMNQIDDPAASERLALLAGDLNELNGRWLPLIEQALARARKSTGQPAEVLDNPPLRSDGEAETPETSDDAAAVRDTVPMQLQSAEDAQAAALAVLSQAAALLGGWRQRFHLSSELDALLADQKQVQQETTDIGRETLAKAVSRLTPQQLADLARLSDRQRRLATRIEQLLEPPGSGRSPDDEGSDDGKPGTASAPSQELLDAQAWLRQQGTSDEMHQAAESLKRNEIPAAASAQENALAALRDFGERLQESPLVDPTTLLTELRGARNEVETLRKQQETLAQSSRQAIGPTADPSRDEQLQRLVEQQSELAEEAQDLSARLKRRQHAAAARTADRASRRMRDAQSALEQQQPEGIAVNQQEALDDLDQLANELEVLQQQAKADLAGRLLHELADNLRNLANEQQVLREGTSDLDVRQRQRGSWSRSLRRELLELVERQGALRTQLNGRLAELNDFPVVLAALEGAGEAMDRSAALLDNEQTGDLTVAAQQEAEDRLLAVVETASETSGGEGGPPPSSRSQDGGRQSPQPAPDLHLATQLKLLRWMQADVNRRTAELTSAGDDAAGAETIQASRESIAREQGRIADLSRELLQRVIDAPMPAAGDDRAREKPQ